jgi:hypothetical protein
MAPTVLPQRTSRVPLLTLIHPRDSSRLFLTLFLVGILLGWLAVTQLSLPVWAAVVITLGLLLYPATRKWWADGQQWGRSVMILSILLATQGFHTIEHLAQWIQYHILHWPLKASSGLISPLNAEIIHFSWNWMVLLIVGYLLSSGQRNRWMWLLLIWVIAHTAEHTYMFSNYLAEVERLSRLGLPLSSAQGLPGVLGKGGWLAANAAASGPLAFICTLAPALMNAPRLDIHFWWNAGEIVLLLVAANATMMNLLPRPLELEERSVQETRERHGSPVR